MNDQAYCPECHGLLPSDAKGELCTQCLLNRRVSRSKMLWGSLLALLSGAWMLFWVAVAVSSVTAINRGGGREAVGDAAGGAMMIVPGLFVLVMGILMMRSARKPHKVHTPQGAPQIQNCEPSLGWTVLSGLTGCAVAFLTMIFVPPILFVALVYRVFGWPYTFYDISGANLAVATGGMLGVGAALGIVVGRRLRTRPESPALPDIAQGDITHSPTAEPDVAPGAASRPPVDGKRRRLIQIAVCGGIACLGAILFWALASKEPVTHEIILGTQPGEERTFAGIKFCWCPAGSFTMGSPESEAGRKKNEGPQHTVTFKQGFWMSKYEVTHGQWKSVAGFHPEALKGSQNLPMQMIDWHECQDFLHKLNAKRAGTFRLPSEAEWEYACRAGTQTAFSFGETLSMEQANLDRSKSTDVGSFPGNAWNLCDMHGNVREWCQDGWHEDYTGAPTDGSAWESPEGQNRVFRSGNWSNYDYGAADRRSAARGNDIGGLHAEGLGFRIVRNP